MLPDPLSDLYALPPQCVEALAERLTLAEYYRREAADLEAVKRDEPERLAERTPDDE